MFISVLDLFKIGIGPSSSHTTGPMVAAKAFTSKVVDFLTGYSVAGEVRVRCILKGSLSFTGRGHATDRAITLGLHGWSAEELAGRDVDKLMEELWTSERVFLSPLIKNESRSKSCRAVLRAASNQTARRTVLSNESALEPLPESESTIVFGGAPILFSPESDIVFDEGEPLPQHPNGMIFEMLDAEGNALLTETVFSIGGGFVSTLEEVNGLVAPLRMTSSELCPYPFPSAAAMLNMARASGLSIAGMKLANELVCHSDDELNRGLDKIWNAMRISVERGLSSEGKLPGGLGIERRARRLHDQLLENGDGVGLIDWLCAYAMAVSEENAAGHMVVTAPTNGAAGVIPAVLYYLEKHEGLQRKQVREFLLTAAAIGGLIKHRSSISGAEVGCQGEVGSASAMAAAGLCAVRGGSPEQVENAAEIAMEHHLGMTCDPVKGLVQVPCIERNGFGAVKAFTAASLALRGSGTHFMPLDACIAAMKQTGLEMSSKFKETSLGGLAVSLTEC